MKPVVALIHNTATNRWHPALFHPIENDELGVGTRYESSLHDMMGFATKEAAEANMRDVFAPNFPLARISNRVFECNDPNDMQVAAFFDEVEV